MTKGKNISEASLEKSSLWGDLPLHLMVPFLNSFRWLGILCSVDKATHAKLLGDYIARSHWVDLAVSLTSYPERGFDADEIRKSFIPVQEKGVSNHIFLDFTRGLVCPWTSRYDILPTRRFMERIPAAKYMFLSKDSSRLIFQSGDDKDLYQASCPSKVTPDFQANMVFQEVKDVNAPSDLDFTQEVTSRLSRPLNMWDFTCTKPNEACFSWFPLHGSVVAVMAFFNRVLPSYPEGENGVYFFCTTDNRMLTHLSLDGIDVPDKSFMQSRPSQLWILLNGKVGHFFQRANVVPYEPNVILSKKTERMDPAFWMVSFADANDALEFFSRDLDGLSINERNPFNKRTLLHYAAKAGQSSAVERLMDVNAKPFLRDFNGETPLQLACKGLHHEAVRAILDGTGIDIGITEQFRMCWRSICDFKLNDACASMDEVSIIHLCRVAIPDIVRSLLFHRKPSIMSLENDLMTALGSPTILASSEAVEIIFLMGGSDIRERFSNESKIRFFFGINTVPQLQRETLETLKMAVSEFRFDVNYRRGLTQETALIWAVRKGKEMDVRTLVDELRADITVKCNQGYNIRALAVNRLMNKNTDPEAHKILEYIDSILLD